MTNCDHKGEQFIAINLLINDVQMFAESNPYIQPEPPQKMLSQFFGDLQQLLILCQQIKLMPDVALKESLQQVSALYLPTTRGLMALYMSAPDPEGARNWFDYQREYKARNTYINNLTALLNWQEAVYDGLIQAYPLLPVPYEWPQSNEPDTPPESVQQQTFQENAYPKQQSESDFEQLMDSDLIL